MKKFWITTIFWGSVWGAAEATLGYLLHLVPGIAGSVMFPIGLFCMRRAVATTGSGKSIPVITLIAAGFKLLDLLLPSWHTGSVINPALCIIFEGMAACLFCFLAEKSGKIILPAALSAVGWRLLFLGWHALKSSGKSIERPESFFYLLLAGVFINILLISSIIHFERNNFFKDFSDKISEWKTAAATAFSIAVISELVIQSL